MSRATRERLDKLERFYAERLAQDDPALAGRARDRLMERLHGIQQRLNIQPVELPPDLTAARVAVLRKLIRAHLNESMYHQPIGDDELAALRTEMAAHDALTAKYAAAGALAGMPV